MIWVGLTPLELTIPPFKGPFNFLNLVVGTCPSSLTQRRRLTLAGSSTVRHLVSRLTTLLGPGDPSGPHRSSTGPVILGSDPVEVGSIEEGRDVNLESLNLRDSGSPLPRSQVGIEFWTCERPTGPYGPGAGFRTNSRRKTVSVLCTSSSCV